MGQFLILLSRIVQISNLVSIGAKILEKLKLKKPAPAPVPTPTDVIINAIKKSDQICYDMETVGLMLQSLVEENKKSEIEPEKKENLQEVLARYGLPKETFDQMAIWNKNAQFGWSSFRDELKILASERMTPEQKKDRVVNKKISK